MKDDNNVIDFEDRKLIADSQKAIESIERIFHEAVQHQDLPEVQEFLRTMAMTMEELAKEMEALDKDIEAFNKETEE